jgi:hypothetical protein
MKVPKIAGSFALCCPGCFGLIAINLFRLSLGWSTEFEGDSHHPGVADRVFTDFGTGFRSDFQWL